MLSAVNISLLFCVRKRHVHRGIRIEVEMRNLGLHEYGLIANLGESRERMYDFQYWRK